MLIKLLAPLLILALTASTSAQVGPPPDWFSKLDPLLQQRASVLAASSSVVVRAVDSASLQLVIPIVTEAGGTLRRTLPIIDGLVATLPHTALSTVAGSPLVQRLSFDRQVVGALERTGRSVGATAVRQELGYDGSGIGVAIIDSGITGWHDDLADSVGALRVDRFVDFVNGRTVPYDDHGHGTHVAGIVAGNGFDSAGARSGIAPAVRLSVFKTLDASAKGRISDVIAALGYILANKDALNIRVVNLSVATGVYESYYSDPLTLAAQRLVVAGVVVVAAGGNNGRDPQGRTHYGGVTAPGNAPWVLTVGATSHMGTVARADDDMAAFSSRGPSAVDYAAKPDVVAPGVGIESLSDPDSSLYTTLAQYLLPGSVATSYLPYLSLSGTSMSTPVVTGTVALMLQANPALTPNQVKAILQYTSQVDADYDALTQGAGYLNAKGAVDLVRFLATNPNAVHAIAPKWSARIVWGNQLVRGGRLTGDANAWASSVTWGAARTTTGQNVDWGVICPVANCEGSPGTWRRWGASCVDTACTQVIWAEGNSQNVVWGSTCGGNDCRTVWSPAAAAEVLLGPTNGTSVVWGTEYDESVVWGTSCGDPSCEPVIWGSE